MNDLQESLNNMLKNRESQGKLWAQITKLRTQYDESECVFRDLHDDLLSDEYICGCGGSITYQGNAHDVLSADDQGGKWTCECCEWERSMKQVRSILNEMTSSEFVWSLTNGNDTEESEG